MINRSERTGFKISFNILKGVRSDIGNMVLLIKGENMVLKNMIARIPYVEYISKIYSWKWMYRQGARTDGRNYPNDIKKWQK